MWEDLFVHLFGNILWTLWTSLFEGNDTTIQWLVAGSIFLIAMGVLFLFYDLGSATTASFITCGCLTVTACVLAIMKH